MKHVANVDETHHRQVALEQPARKRAHFRVEQHQPVSALRQAVGRHDVVRAEPVELVRAIRRATTREIPLTGGQIPQRIIEGVLRGRVRVKTARQAELAAGRKDKTPGTD
jgi:hypothetical protein